MINKKGFTLFLATLSISYSVSAKNMTLEMGTGGPSGNYIAMGKDINTYCADELSVKLNVLESDGSVDNLLGMLNKKYDLGIVQSDVLHFNAERAPNKVNRNRVKVISGLHEEAIHLLIPKGYNPEGKKKGMWSSLFAKKGESKSVEEFKLSMLKNHKVGATGGSIVSAEALSYFFDLNLKVYEAITSVNDTSTPMVIVGGAPYSIVKSYLDTGKWMLATLNYKDISDKAPFYLNQTVNYRIDGKMQSISTLGVRALLIGKAFRDKKRNKPMTELATCIYNNIVDLTDDNDTNSNWNSVYEYIEDGEQSDWSYFPIGDTKAIE